MNESIRIQRSVHNLKQVEFGFLRSGTFGESLIPHLGIVFLNFYCVHRLSEIFLRKHVKKMHKLRPCLVALEIAKSICTL